MVDVIVSAEARADVLDIYARGFDDFGEEVADAYIDGIEHALARLRSFPEIGPIYPGLRPPARFLAYRRHHILYDFDGTTVYVIRILHHAQDVRSLF
jgi:toxin ParE1/3/4